MSFPENIPTPLELFGGATVESPRSLTHCLADTALIVGRAAVMTEEDELLIVHRDGGVTQGLRIRKKSLAGKQILAKISQPQFVEKSVRKLT